MSERSTDKNKDMWSEGIEVTDKEKLKTKLKSWIGQAQKGDYLGIQAYLASSPSTSEALQGIRHAFLKKTHLKIIG